MGLFNKNQQEAQPVSQRQLLEGRYASARNNLLWILLFTVVNIGMLLAQKFTYFLFSAFIPYAIVDLGMYVCGKLPAEFYEGDLSEYQFFGDTVLILAVVVAAVICVLYLLCWLFSKKGRVAWLIVGLVLFVLDTILMFLNGISLDSILDVVFHCLAIFSMSRGVAAHFKLKDLPPEEEEPAAPSQEDRTLEEELTEEQLPQV